MGQRIGTAEVGVEVLDEQAIAGLRRIEAQFESTAKRIDRMRADAEFGADTSDLDQSVANAKRKIREIEGLRASAKLAVDKKRYTKELKEAWAELKALDGRKATMELELRGDDKVKKALADAEKAQAAADKEQAKRLRDQDRLIEQSHKRRMGAMREEMKLRQQSIAGRLFSEQELERRQSERDNGILERLKNTYGELGKKLDDLAHKRAQGAKSAKEERELDAQQLQLLSRIQRVRTEIAQHTSEQRDNDRAAAAREKELAQVPRMQLRYAQLARTLETLNAKKRQGNQLERQTTRLKIGSTVAEMKTLKETLERVGSPVDIDVELHPGRRFGSNIRDALGLAQLRGGPLVQARAVGRVIGEEVESGFKRRFTRERISDAVMAPFGAAGRALGKLGDMSVRLGPFTTSVRGALLAMTLLGPVVVDVIGSLGALVGSLGSATLGAGALTTALVGGGVPAMLGMALVAKDVVQEFQAVKKAQKAYDDALQKNNAPLAAKKLKELRAVMGNVSQETAKQVGSAQELGRAWDSATKPGRASIWKTIGQGIKSATDIMPMFAQRTNQALATTGRSVRTWMRNISSKPGQGILDSLLGNFNDALGPALNGLGQLTAYLAKLGVSAGRSLPGLMNQFKNWARGLNSAANNTDLLNAKTDSWMNSLRTVGRFLLSGTRWLKSFFGGGVDAGNSFLDVMSETMNRWTAFNNTLAGQQKLGKFFGDSIDGVRALYAALAPIAGTFVTWATEISPFVSAVLRGAGAVGQLVSGILSVTALRSPLLAIATTLGALWAVNKLASFVAGLRGFVMGLFGVSRANATTAASSNAASAALNRQGAAATRTAAQMRALAAANVAASRGSAAAVAASSGAAAMAARSAAAGRYAVVSGPVGGNLTRQAAQAERAAASTGRLAKAGGAAKAALGGLGAVVMGTSSVLAGAAIVATAASVGLFMYLNRTRDWEKAGKAATEQMKSWNQQSAQLNSGNNEVASSTLQAQQAALSLKQANREVSDSEKELTKLRKAGKQGTDEYKAAQDRVTQARLSAKSAQLQEVTMRRQNKAMIDAERTAIEKSLNTAAKAKANAESSKQGAGQIETGQIGGEFKGDTVAQAYDKVKKAADAAGQSVSAYINANRDGNDVLDMLAPNLLKYGQLVDKSTAATNAYNRAQDQTILESLNLERAIRGLVAIGPKAAKVFGDLTRATGNKKLTMQIATKFTNPNEAQKVAASTRATLKSGSTQTVTMRIIADSKTAEEAMSRLKAARIDTKKLRIVMNGGPEAVKTMEDLAGRKLTDKEAKAVIKGGAAAESVIAKINGRKIADKAARVIAKDLASAVIAAINGKQVGGKVVTVSARDAASSVINAFRGIQVIGQKIIEIITRKKPGKAAGGVTMRAAGGDYGEETAATQRAQERAYSRSESGNLPRSSTGQLARGAKIAGGPRAIYGEEPAHPEFVISTNPAYRDSNRDYLRMAANYLGVHVAGRRGAVDPKQRDNPDEPLMMASGGATSLKAVKMDARKPKVTNKKKASTGKKWRTPSVSSAMNKVDNAEKAEETREWDLNRFISNLKEPASFVDETKDAKTGLIKYTFNAKRLADWQGQLAEVSKGYGELETLRAGKGGTEEAITNAEAIVKEVDKTAQKNIDNFNKAIATEDRIIKKNGKKGGSKTALANAKKRRVKLLAEMNSEKANLDNAGEAKRTLKDKREDSRRRGLEYGDSKAEYDDKGSTTSPTGAQATAEADYNASVAGASGAAGDVASVGQQAVSNADRVAALTSAGLPGGAASMVEAINGQIQAQQARMNEGAAMLNDGDTSNDMEANDIITSAANALEALKSSQKSAGEFAIQNADTIAALTDAGLAGGAASMQDAIQGQITAQSARLAEGMAMLSDGITTNDEEGNQIVQQTAGALKGLKDSLKELANAGTSSASEASTALYDISNQIKEMFKSYGSNIIDGGFPTVDNSIASNNTVTSALAGTSSVAGLALRPGTQGAEPQQVHNTYNVDMTSQPLASDPHTFAAQLKWELKTAI